MTCCELRDSCFFFNKQEKDMPRTTDYLRRLYCTGDRFEECVLHKIAVAYGIDTIPKYLYPNDMFEILYFNLVARQEGLDMFLKVIYPDGASGMVKAAIIEGLIRTGKIVAFLCSEGWVEVRRKQKNEDYFGPERRVTGPVHM